MFLDSQHIGHYLARVLPVGEGVDHRNIGVGRKFFQALMFKYPGYDAINVTREHSGHVGYGLSDAQSNLVLAHVYTIPAHLLDTHFEAGPSAEGGFLEQERNALALEGLDRTVRLHLASPPEQIGGLLGTEIGD